MTGLLALAWFTIKRHRQRDLENQTFDPPPTGSVRHSMSAGDIPPGNVRSRIIDDDPDLEIQSSVGHDVRSSSIGHGAIVSTLFPVELVESPGEISEQRIDHENGYYTVAASSNGHSSHGHNTIKTRNSSLTQVNVTSRNTSPTLSRQNPNRARFSLSPDRTSIPNAWYTSRSEAPSRRRSVDDASIVSYNPHRVNSEPVVLGDAPQLMSIYPRRQSSEIPRSDVFPRPGPPILVHAPPLNPPSSLLRPPSATQIPTLQTLQRSQPSTVYLDLPFVNEPFPSPTASNVSVLSGREGLLGTPPHHPTESLSSLRDEYDYSRRISVGVSVSCLSSIQIEPDSRCCFPRSSVDYGTTRVWSGQIPTRMHIQIGMPPVKLSVRVNLPFLYSILCIHPLISSMVSLSILLALSSFDICFLFSTLTRVTF